MPVVVKEESKKLRCVRTVAGLSGAYAYAPRAFGVARKLYRFVATLKYKTNFIQRLAQSFSLGIVISVHGCSGAIGVI